MLQWRELDGASDLNDIPELKSLERVSKQRNDHRAQGLHVCVANKETITVHRVYMYVLDLGIVQHFPRKVAASAAAAAAAGPTFAPAAQVQRQQRPIGHTSVECVCSRIQINRTNG
jgi:hypothetical protein